MRSAKVTIFTGVPISNTKIRVPVANVAASITRRHASGIVIKNRFISGWVTVTGPPCSICSRNRGMTEPFEPRTLPKRVVTNFVLPFISPRSIANPSDCTYISASRFVQPIILVGLTALSVETITIFSRPHETLFEDDIS